MDRARWMVHHSFKEAAYRDETSIPRVQDWDEKGQGEVSTPESYAGTSRRAFLGQIRGAAAATLAASAVELGPLTRPARGEERTRGRDERARECFEVRERAAEEEREVPIPPQASNGDEKRYRNFIGNYSKGLPHNSIGEVDRDAYESLLDAAEEGTAGAFERGPLCGTVKLST